VTWAKVNPFCSDLTKGEKKNPKIISLIPVIDKGHSFMILNNNIFTLFITQHALKNDGFIRNSHTFNIVPIL